MPERPAVTRALIPPNSRRAEFAKLFLPPGSRRRIAAKNMFDAATGRVGLLEALADTPTSEDGRLRRFIARNRPQLAAAGVKRGVHVVDTSDARFDPADLPADDLVVFAAPGDVHEPELVPLLAATDPSLDLVSWDDVTIGDDGGPTEPRVRPRWSPDTHRVAPYLHRCFAVRAGAIATSQWHPVGAGPTLAGGSPVASAAVTITDVDLWRLVEAVDPDPGRTLRLPWFLSRTRRRTDRLPADAVAESLARRGIDARPGSEGLRLDFADTAPRPTVTIVVPTRHHRENMGQLLPALANTAHDGVELVVVDNGGRSGDNEAWYASQPFADRTTVHWWTRPFNWSAVNNFGASLGSGEILVFCNDDALPVRGDWLADLCGWLTVPGVGAAGPLIVDSRDRVGEAGIAAGLADLCEHFLRGADPRGVEMVGPVGWPRDVLAVTGACVAVTAATFDAVGGFDEEYELTGSDVAFGVAVVEAGLRNVCTGLASVRHDERTTRSGPDHPHDVDRLTARLAPYLDDDPVFSAQLSRWHACPRLATAAEQRDRRIPGAP
ncbi:MAG: glycosyltransferase [Acidimicrobiales bacterium]